jgi:hypothetical protein
VIGSCSGLGCSGTASSESVCHSERSEESDIRARVFAQSALTTLK